MDEELLLKLQTHVRAGGVPGEGGPPLHALEELAACGSLEQFWRRSEPF